MKKFISIFISFFIVVSLVYYFSKSTQESSSNSKKYSQSDSDNSSEKNLKTVCEKEGVSVKLFSNTCVDECYPTGEERVCGMALTYGCDCGPDKCWYEGKCIPSDDN
ncbi:MAG: hypothetical protein HYW47_04740 [Deltaproteobacteria bacterium]|nr:hypothetical protein [Deltaproteobacteria bacterium]